MGVDEPPPDPPPASDQTILAFLDDLRRAGISPPPMVISRLSSGVQVPTSDGGHNPDLRSSTRSQLVTAMEASPSASGADAVAATLDEPRQSSAGGFPRPSLSQAELPSIQPSMNSGQLSSLPLQLPAAEFFNEMMAASVGTQPAMAIAPAVIPPPFVFSSQVSQGVGGSTGPGENVSNSMPLVHANMENIPPGIATVNTQQVNGNAFVDSQNNLNNSAVSASVTSIANTDSASLNAITNANIGGSVTHGLNSTTVHGMTSLNNATPVSVPIVNASNASNLRSGNNANINRNLPSINILPSADNANFDKNMPSVFNANVAKSQPSAVFGSGTAYTNARRNDTSKNPNNSRVNFQPSSQPSGGGVSQPPNAQNQAQEGTGLTKAQKKHLAKKRRREKGKDPIIDVGLGNFSVPQVAVGVGTSTNPVLGFSQPVAPIPISTCNTFTLLQDVNETVLAEGAQTQEVVHDTTLANQAHTQEATTKDFDAELDDHLAKVLDKEGVPQVQSQEEPQVQSQNDTQTPIIAHTPTRANNEDAHSSPTQVEDSSTQGDASSAAPISMGLQTPVKEQGTGLCLLNTEQATIPTVSPVAHNTKAPVTKRTRRTRSASEQSNVAGFYREASDDDDDSDSSVAGRVAIFESAGRNREFVGGHGSPPKTSKVPFGGRITRSQVRPEQSSAAVGTPISSQSPSF
nr:hypothetical protein Iba_chr13bCG16200 [Ipomoea batatas]